MTSSSSAVTLSQVSKLHSVNSHEISLKLPHECESHELSLQLIQRFVLYNVNECIMEDVITSNSSFAINSFKDNNSFNLVSFSALQDTGCFSHFKSL